MSQPNTPETTPKASTGQAKTGIVLGLLASLFAGGLVLLYALTGGGEIQLAGPTQTPPAAAERQPTEPTTPAADFATGAELAALEAQLAEAQARIDTLSAQSGSFADTLARIDGLEADVAAAKAAADAAASQAAEVTQRYTELTTDYAKLGAQFTPEGVLIRLDETVIAFAPGTAELPADADTALAEIAGFLSRHPGQRALLRGHTDATGRAETNVSLSEQRATAVRAALVALGVAAERLGVEGVGAAEPISDNTSAAGRSRNRRVDILLRPADLTAG